MQTSKKWRRIEPGWRYSLAQLVLRFLFGRKWHYISPWQHASITGNVVFTHKGKVLLGLRCGDTEGSGTFGFCGGHITIEENESIEQGTAREVYEECGVLLDESHFSMDNLLKFYVYHGLSYLEKADASQCAFFFHHELTKEQFEQVRDSDEMKNFKLYTIEEVEALYKQDLILGGHWLIPLMKRAVEK